MIEKRMIEITPFGLWRQLHIYVPDDYDETDKSYPVFYMFDGHNLFFDEDATYGHAWHISEQYEAAHVDCIVVGLECNHEGRERLHEFCPYPVKASRLGSLDGRGAALMAWMATELKDEIAAQYRTNGIHYIGGSSMGGLMALYGIIKYPEVYTGAACLSSSFFLCERQLLSDLTTLEKHRVYLSYGGNEVTDKNQLCDVVIRHMRIMDACLNHGAMVTFDLIKDGNHSEATWDKQVMTYTKWLGIL